MTIFSQVYLFTKEQLFYIGTKNYFLQPTINIVVYFPTGTGVFVCGIRTGVTPLSGALQCVGVNAQSWGRSCSEWRRVLPAPHVSAGVVSSS